jgi:two-component system, OmpR family, KDP operon response regulator KdpE
MGDRVLVVDDELSILRVVAANLRARGYEALTAATGEDALTVLEAQEPDCIVLDLGLPDVGGRRTMAFDLGVDDYVTKPFAMGDLLARVRRALQQGRSRSPNRPRRIEVGPVCIDLDTGLVTRGGHTGLVTRGGQPVRLTGTEYRLLEILATSGGRLCTSRFLSERLWGTGSEQEDRSLQEHVASLRRKLDDPSVPELLVTEPGIGYRFVVPT